MAESKSRQAPQPQQQAEPAAPKAALTTAQAAKRVQRSVQTDDGAAFVPVRPEEILQFCDYGTHVVVVTVDGQKFSSLDAGGSDHVAAQ